jgi:hypothetical protein
MDSGFYFRWKHFFLGFFFALIGVAFTLFSREDRKDKIHSALLGFALNLIVGILMMKYGLLPESMKELQGK